MKDKLVKVAKYVDKMEDWFKDIKVEISLMNHKVESHITTTMHFGQ